MTETLSHWFEVIKNCSVSNTYKMGWSKSIVKVRKYTISDLNTIVLFIGFTLIELTKMFL